MKFYTYGPNKVRALIPRVADIVSTMQPNGRYAYLVQEVLDTTEPWPEGESPIEEMSCSVNILPRAIRVPEGAEVVWGIHRGHKARNPQPSPFIDLDEIAIEVTGSIVVVVLAGTPNRPLLVQAYPGDPETGGYIPPLPWMLSAQKADGGERACFDYWRTHAYLSAGLRLIKESTRTAQPKQYTI